MKRTQHAPGIVILLGIMTLSAVCAVRSFSQPIEDPVRAALRKSLLHFSQVLNVCQRQDKSHLKDFLQAAIDEAKKAQDSKLTETLARLRDDFVASGKFNEGIASQVAKMYNNYITKYKWAYPLFNTANPLVKATGSVPY